jgi:hydrogenase maturation protease
VGNILFTDEGIGVRAVQYLEEHYRFPEQITLLDGGTLGMGLMSALMDSDLVLILDAVLGGEAPGSLYRLTGEDLRKSVSFRDSMHQTDLVDTLIFCELAGHRPEAVVLGMEPFDYQSMAMELSPIATESLPRLATLALDELEQNGVKVRCS